MPLESPVMIGPKSGEAYNSTKVMLDRVKNLEAESAVQQSRIDHLESSGDNYRIEKDLLKETYSNNYERINLFITAILGLFGILGFLGIKDINSIKKDYRAELASLRTLQDEFRAKTLDLESQKKIFSDEIAKLIDENKLQNRRIQLVELKAKAQEALAKNDPSGLDFANLGLGIDENEPQLLSIKGCYLTRSNNLAAALACFNQIMIKHPGTNNAQNIGFFNALECLYFMGRIDEAKVLIRENQSAYDIVLGNGIKSILSVFEIYHNTSREGLTKEIRESLLLKQNPELSFKRLDWSLTEAHAVVEKYANGPSQQLLQRFLWCCDGRMSAKEMLDQLR
ncbi:MAG: hypothetical protein ABI432_07575, partial [Flavobacteriales bacterium]